MIRGILFDLDDTLLWDRKSIDTAFRKTCAYAASKAKVDAVQLEKSVRSSARRLYESYDTYEFTKMIGINPFEGLWGRFDDPGDEFGKMKELAPIYQRDAWTDGLRETGIADRMLGAELAVRFRDERKACPFVYEETFDVLGRLQKDGFRLALLTNGAPSLQMEKLSLTPELAPYFDGVIISGAYGKGKPDEGIFRHALEAMGIPGEEALMVGDNCMTDILGASRAGIRSAWLNREGKQAPRDVQPTYEIQDLTGLFAILEQADQQTV